MEINNEEGSPEQNQQPANPLDNLFGVVLASEGILSE